MPTKEKTWRERVKLAAEFLKLDQQDQYLSPDDNDYPWEYAVDCEPGGSHRLEIDTSVWFRANHPSGLKFRWWFEIEHREANGRGHYMIDVDGCQSVLAQLKGPCKAAFQKYLKDAAKKVRAKADEWQKVTDSQYKTADDLERAAKA